VFGTILHANNGSDGAFQALSTALHLEMFAQVLALGKDTCDAARDAGYNQNAYSFEANPRQRASFPEVNGFGSCRNAPLRKPRSVLHGSWNGSPR
jgi:hypothetical protein